MPESVLDGTDALCTLDGTGSNSDAQQALALGLPAGAGANGNAAANADLGKKSTAIAQHAPARGSSSVLRSQANPSGLSFDGSLREERDLLAMHHRLLLGEDDETGEAGAWLKASVVEASTPATQPGGLGIQAKGPNVFGGAKCSTKGGESRCDAGLSAEIFGADLWLGSLSSETKGDTRTLVGGHLSYGAGCTGWDGEDKDMDGYEEAGFICCGGPVCVGREIEDDGEPWVPDLDLAGVSWDGMR